ncbi:MAG: type II 3-dehydroquinate dehydratase [Candidatus Omnitrophota bacterium]|nr:MAG: type II 3-dehydroquinate dehydratase [Candidatus Omnitrophota bacterium]
MKKSKKNKVLVIHGPNLHLLGKREPDIYGGYTLSQINKELKARAKKSNISIKIFQSNSEGEIVEEITNTQYDFLIINPAAYTHTSVAIRDALLGVDRPAIEVHLSNIYKREDFRKKSLISDVVLGVISGFGKTSYLLALEAAAGVLRNKSR